MTFPVSVTAARSAAACVVLIGALFAVPAFSHQDRAVAQGASDLRSEAQLIDSASGIATRRRVRLQLGIGACTTRVDVKRVLETSKSVRIELTRQAHAGPCTDNLISYCVELTLRKPLGKRRIVDLSRTRVVKRDGLGIYWASGACQRPGPVVTK